MAKSPPIEDSEITKVMIEILQKPKNDAICGVGRGGLNTDDFNEAVLLSFEPPVRAHVLSRIIDLQKVAPLHFVIANGDGDPAVCVDGVLVKAVEAGKAATQTEIIDTIADRLKERLFKKDVALVLGELKAMIAEHVGQSGPGKFTILGLCAVDVDRSEPEASVSIRPLKELIDMANS